MLYFVISFQMGLKMFYISDDPFKKTFPMIPRLNSRLKYKSNSILAHDSKSLGVTISPDIFPHHFFFLACFSSSLQFTRLFAYFLQISSSLQFMSPCFKNFPQFTCSLLSLDFFPTRCCMTGEGGTTSTHLLTSGCSAAAAPSAGSAATEGQQLL
jgi:hypothetical protein